MPKVASATVVIDALFDSTQARKEAKDLEKFISKEFDSLGDKGIALNITDAGTVQNVISKLEEIQKLTGDTVVIKIDPVWSEKAFENIGDMPKKEVEAIQKLFQTMVDSVSSDGLKIDLGLDETLRETKGKLAAVEDELEKSMKKIKSLTAQINNDINSKNTRFKDTNVDVNELFSKFDDGTVTGLVKEIRDRYEKNQGTKYEKSIKENLKKVIQGYIAAGGEVTPENYKDLGLNFFQGFMKKDLDSEKNKEELKKRIAEYVTDIKNTYKQYTSEAYKKLFQDIAIINSGYDYEIFGGEEESKAPTPDVEKKLRDQIESIKKAFDEAEATIKQLQKEKTQLNKEIKNLLKLNDLKFENGSGETVSTETVASGAGGGGGYPTTLDMTQVLQQIQELEARVIELKVKLDESSLDDIRFDIANMSPRPEVTPEFDTEAAVKKVRNSLKKLDITISPKLPKGYVLRLPLAVIEDLAILNKKRAAGRTKQGTTVDKTVNKEEKLDAAGVYKWFSKIKIVPKSNTGWYTRANNELSAQKNKNTIPNEKTILNAMGFIKNLEDEAEKAGKQLPDLEKLNPFSKENLEELGWSGKQVTEIQQLAKNMETLIKEGKEQVQVAEKRQQTAKKRQEREEESAKLSERVRSLPDDDPYKTYLKAYEEASTMTKDALKKKINDTIKITQSDEDKEKGTPQKQGVRDADTLLTVKGWLDWYNDNTKGRKLNSLSSQRLKQVGYSKKEGFTEEQLEELDLAIGNYTESINRRKKEYEEEDRRIEEEKAEAAAARAEVKKAEAEAQAKAEAAEAEAKAKQAEAAKVKAEETAKTTDKEADVVDENHISAQVEQVKDQLENSGGIKLKFEADEESVAALKTRIEDIINPIKIITDPTVEEIINDVKNSALTAGYDADLDKAKGEINNLGKDIDTDVVVKEDVVADTDIDIPEDRDFDAELAHLQDTIKKINNLLAGLDDTFRTSTEEIISLVKSQSDAFMDLMQTILTVADAIDEVDTEKLQMISPVAQEQQRQARLVEKKANPNLTDTDRRLLLETIDLYNEISSDVIITKRSVLDNGLIDMEGVFETASGSVKRFMISLRDLQAIMTDGTFDVTKIKTMASQIETVMTHASQQTEKAEVKLTELEKEYLDKINHLMYVLPHDASTGLNKDVYKGLDDVLNKIGKGNFGDNEIEQYNELEKIAKERLRKSQFRTTNSHGGILYTFEEDFYKDLTKGSEKSFSQMDDLRKKAIREINEYYTGVLDESTIAWGRGGKSFTADMLLENQDPKKITAYFDEYTDMAGKAAVQLRTLTNAEKVSVGSGKTWRQGLAKRITSLTQYITGMGALEAMLRQVRQGFETVREINSGLTTINQTMSVTQEELYNLGSQSIQFGQELGVNAQGVLDAVKIYANANETAESILEKAQPTVMLSNASGTDTATAADQIQAVVNQFEGLEGQEERIVNSYEKISSNLAIDFSKGINSMSEAVQTSGSVADQAGLKFENFAALVGKVAETTRFEGSQIGNAMKTILARTSRSKSGDEEVTDEDRSNASKAYSSIGISLYNDKGEYQDYTKTLDQLAAKWDTLTDAQRNYIAEQSAGVRGVNVFNAMIESWQSSKDLAADALSDTDFIDDVQEKYMESMEAKMATLQATMQGFWYDILDTGVLNSVVDTLTRFVGLLDNTAGGLGTVTSVLSPLLALVGSFANAIASVLGVLDSFTGGLASLVTSITAVAAAWKVFQNMKAGKAFFAGFGIDDMKVQVDKIKDLFHGLKEAAEGEVGHSLKPLGVFKQTIKDLWNDMSGFKKALVGFAAVSVAVGVIDKLITDTKEAAEAAESLRDAYSQQNEVLSQHGETVKSVGAEYATLSQGVSPLGENMSLTTGEFERYHQVCNEIAEMYPTLIKSYDAQGNAILNLKSNLEELNAEYEKERLNLAKQTVYEDFSGYEKNFKNAMGDYGGILGQLSHLWSTAKDNFFGATGDLNVGEGVAPKEAIDALRELQDMTLEEAKAAYSDFSLKFWIPSPTSMGTQYSAEQLDIQDIKTEEEWKKRQAEIPALIEEASTGLEDAAQDYRNVMTSYLDILTLSEDEYPEYKNLDDSLIQQVSGMLSKTSTEQLMNLEEQGVSIKDYVKDTLDAFANDPSLQEALDWVMNITPDMPITDIKAVVENDLASLDEALSYDDANELKVKFGLEDADELVARYDETLDYVTRRISGEDKDILEQSYKDFFDGDMDKNAKALNKQLKEQAKNSEEVADRQEQIRDFIVEQGINTIDELALLKDCAAESANWKEIMESFMLQSIDIEVNDEALSDLEDNLGKIEEDITNMETAIGESQSSAGLSGESIDEIDAMFSQLEGYDYNQLFESTAHGVHLNVQEMERLTGEYNKFEGGKYADQIKELESQYANLCVAIQNSTGAEQANYIQQKNNIVEQIKQAQELQSRFEGLTNSVAAWQRARAGGEEGDTYLDIASNVGNIQTLHDEGLIGTREFKTGVQMMTNEDLAGASYDKILDVYNKKYSEFSSWFTEGSEGIVTFLEKLHSVNEEWASLNSQGDWDINADIEEMAEGLGVSEAAITAIFKRMNDYGFDVDFAESTDYLKGLREEAEKAFSEIDDATKNKYSLKLDYKDIENVDEKVNKAREDLANVDKALSEVGDNDELKGKLEEVKEYLEGIIGESYELDIDFHTAHGLDQLDAQLKSLKDNAHVNLDIDWTKGGPEYYDMKIKDLKTQLEELKDSEGKINLSDDDVVNALNVLTALEWKKNDVSNESAILKVDTSQLTGSLGDAIGQLQAIQDQVTKINGMEAAAEFLKGLGFEIDTTSIDSAKNELGQLVSDYQSIKGEASTGIKLNFDTSQEGLAELPGKVSAVLDGIDAEKLVEMGVDSSAIDGYTPPDKTAVIEGDITDVVDKMNKVDLLVNKVRDLKITATNLDKIKSDLNWVLANNEIQITRTEKIIRETVETTSTPNRGGNSNVTERGYVQVNGNAHSIGNAFLRGVWGAAKSGLSLMGELGQELIVRGNRFFTVGDEGAEMFDVQKGDIIFNHKQTEEILKNGYVTSDGGRGRMANAAGNAYVSGKYTTSGSLPGSNKTPKSSSSKKSTSSKSSSSTAKNAEKAAEKVKDSVEEAEEEADEFLETFDWVEVMIDRIERSIEHLDTVVGSAYKTFSQRNKALGNEFDEIVDEINLQANAYNTYMAKANSLGLSEAYASKVRSGTLQIEDITDEELSDKIKDYQDWYEKAIDCQQAIDDLNEELGDLAKQNFENVTEEFEYLLDGIEHRITNIETGLDMVEAKGNFASRSYFTSLMETETQSLNMLGREYESLTKAFNQAMNSGAIEENSEAWYEMREQINEVQEAYQEAQLALIEYKNEMREMDWSAFEKGQEYVSELTEEANFLIDLLSLNENDLFSKESGKLNDYGNTAGGLHAVNYNAYMSMADEYRKKMEEVNRELANDPYNTILIDKRNEYLRAQQEAITNANEEKKAVQDLISESYERMLDILQELIDKRKESLQAEKDLYDYEKQVSEQVKEITDYRKQLLALEGDTSEDAKARRQQLQTSLTEAEGELEETEYDKWLDDQGKLLDMLYDEYEQVLNERLDYIDELMREMIDYTNANSEMMNQTIHDVTIGPEGVGYQLSEAMRTIWDTDSANITRVVSDYNTNFSNTLTTTNAAIRDIYNLIQGALAKAEAEKAKNTVTTPAAPAKPSTSGSVGTKTSPQKSGKVSSPAPQPAAKPASTAPKKGSFFIYKKDNYPKNKLRVD